MDTVWPEIQRRARSPHPFDRTAALMRAVSAVERALTVVGMTDQLVQGGVARRARFFLKQGDAPNAIDAACRARNRAVHSLQSVPSDTCRRSVAALQMAFRAIRRRWVRRDRAVTVATILTESGLLEKIFLFGSLTRSVRAPEDIDLLLFDRGQISYLVDPRYRSSAASHTELVLRQTPLKSEEYTLAAELGWLQFIVLDGRLFGRDRDYTWHVVRAMPDPLFFLNISADLKRYDDASKGRWSNDVPEFFQRWGTMREQLEKDGLLALRATGRSKIQRRLTSR